MGLIQKYEYYNWYIRLINDQFKVGDSEILIAANYIDFIWKILLDNIKSISKI